MSANTVTLTKEQQEIADVAVMALIELPAEHQVPALKRILEMYIDALITEFPDISEEAVRTNAINYHRAILARLRTIVASGACAGHG